MESTEEFFRMQAEAVEAVAKLIGVNAEDVLTDVESFDPEPPFVVWECRGRYGHYDNGIMTETTGMRGDDGTQ